MNKKSIEDFLPIVKIIGESLEYELETSFSEIKNVSEIIECTKQEFLKQAQELPELGQDNPWLKSLFGVCYLSGLWLKLESMGYEINEISVLTQMALEKFTCNSISEEEIPQISDIMSRIDTVKQIAERSRLRKYKEDWICECVIPKEGDNFRAGINVYQCPIKDYCEKLNIERFFPYFCLDDYPMNAAMGIELTRTKTISNGESYCDFRLKPLGRCFSNIIDNPSDLKEFKQK